MIYRAMWEGAAGTWALISLDGRKAVARGSAHEVFHEAGQLGATGLLLLDQDGRIMLALQGAAVAASEMIAPWEETVRTPALWAPPSDRRR